MILSQLKLMVVNHIDTVSKNFGEISVAFAVIGTVLANVLGGWDNLINTLLLLVAFDIVTGCLVGFFVHKNLTSKRLREGFGTKIMYLVVVAVGHALDSVFFADTPVLRNLALFFYIYVEGVSVLENLGNMGVPIPQKVVDGLGQVEKRVGGFAKMKDGKFEKKDNSVG